jgi:TRAP-type uncharacterized transport system fused permease subunit
VPIIILIAALFMGYSVIRAGTLATVAAVVVSPGRCRNISAGRRMVARAHAVHGDPVAG